MIETTKEHPFWIEGQGWTVAELLKAGDVVRLESGENAVIDSVEVSSLDEYIKVYNFEVSDFHTYFVSDFDVLVHNSCKNASDPASTKASDLKTIKKGTKEWDDAVKSMKSGSDKSINFRVESANDAKDLLIDGRGNMNRYKRYTSTKYIKGYEFHPI